MDPIASETRRKTQIQKIQKTLEKVCEKYQHNIHAHQQLQEVCSIFKCVKDQLL